MGPEIPRYRCHKEVRALKIKEVILDSVLAEKEERETDGGAILIFEATSNQLSEQKVDYSYMKKHSPKAGGYYVVYEGGYTSFSPAEAFEKGYTLIV